MDVAISYIKHCRVAYGAKFIEFGVARQCPRSGFPQPGKNAPTWCARTTTGRLALMQQNWICSNCALDRFAGKQKHVCVAIEMV
jgi:hypothetical protein